MIRNQIICYNILSIVLHAYICTHVKHTDRDIHMYIHSNININTLCWNYVYTPHFYNKVQHLMHNR